MATEEVKVKTGGKALGLIVIIMGVIYIILGGVTWGAVSSNLAAEKITVSDDADQFVGQLVDTPWEAWVEADVINHHALDATGGKTYAGFPQDDPSRQTVMTASFLRASLFTAVVAFGVALLVMGTGVVLILVGFGLRARSSVTVTTSTPEPAAAPVAPVAAPVAAAPVASHVAPEPAAPVTSPPVTTTAPPTATPPTTAPPATTPPPTTPPASTTNPPDPVV